MMIFKNIFKALLLVGILVVSCIDPIDFAVPAGLSESVVIQARVVKGERNFVEVDVSRLFDFSVESRRPVTVKTVVLSDDNDNQMLLETRVPGKYFQILDGSTAIQAEVGRGYKLRVETLDNRIYESSLDIMPPNKKPQGLNLAIVTDRSVDNLGNVRDFEKIQITIDTEVNIDADGGVYWELSNTYKVTDQGINDPDDIIKVCYIEETVDVDEIYVLDPTQLRDGFIKNYNLTLARIDSRIAEGLFYNVKQYSLSQGAFGYWNGVNILSEREGNIFDGPAGEINSNFTNINDPNDIAFGYFFATQEEIVRKKAVFPELANIRTICPSEKACFAPGGDSCICGLCCDCEVDPNATTIRPAYWID